MLLRVKGLPARPGALVTKDNVRVDVGVEILLRRAVRLENPLERGDGLGITRRTAAAVVGGAALDAVAVNVHVDELAVLALEVDDVVVLDVVAAVRVGLKWSVYV